MTCRLLNHHFIHVLVLVLVLVLRCSETECVVRVRTGSVFVEIREEETPLMETFPLSIVSSVVL